MNNRIPPKNDLYGPPLDCPESYWDYFEEEEHDEPEREEEWYL